MSRQKRSLIDEFLRIYRAMTPEDRPLALAAIRGFDWAMRTPKAKPGDEERFEELGAAEANA